MPNFVKRYKDQEKALVIRNKQRKKYYSKTQGNEPRIWTIEEMDMLFGQDISDTELAIKLKRSVESIQIKRCRIARRT